MRKRKICCVFNYNPLYRYPIYKAMAEEFNCDFFFGDTVFEPLKAFDATKLNGLKKIMKVKRFRSFKWYLNIKDLFNSQYTHYILTGEPFCLTNWIILLYAHFCNKKVLLWCHGQNTDVKKWAQRLFLSTFYNLSNGILLYGEHAQPYMMQLGCKENKLFYIHNSLDTELQTSLFKKQKRTSIYQDYFGNKNPVVIYIGRIQKRKKVDQLVKAIAQLQKENYSVNLVIVGAITDDKSIKECVKEHRIENQVWFYGPSFTEEKNAELLYNADVCVSPGNVGLTSIHSLSYGTPVISNNNFEKQMPEYAAIIPNVTGDFFIENSITDMANYIKKWTSLSFEDRESCRLAARKTILEHWSINYQINLLKEVL